MTIHGCPVQIPDDYPRAPEELKLDEMIDDIRTRGLQEPFEVRWNHDNLCYDVVSGVRRYLALEVIELVTGEEWISCQSCFKIVH